MSVQSSRAWTEVTATADHDHQEGGGREEPAARVLRRELFTDEVIDSMLARVGEGGLSRTGPGGALPELVKSVLERGMELTDHLGYDKGDPAGRGSGNSRNGTSFKTVSSEVGRIELDQPRPGRVVRLGAGPEGCPPVGGLEEQIISLYAGGMTVRDIGHHFERTLGVELSHATISKITDAVEKVKGVAEPAPLDLFYPVVYLDAIVVKVRDGAHVMNWSAHIAVGVDTDGIKHVLGIWVQASEGAKFWASVCRARQPGCPGRPDRLLRSDRFPRGRAGDLTGALVQTCVVHLIRASTRFVAYQDRKAVAALLRPIYIAATEEAALMALAAFADSTLGAKYPATVRTWENAWERFTLFLAFAALRKLIYTTNSIESLNYQLRKIIKNRGHFPNDTAVVKLLWLAIMNIEDKRSWERDEQRGTPANQRTARRVWSKEQLPRAERRSG
ncbi:MAG: IS256 family transposase [Kineosporiaceae bacterium]